MANDAQSRGVSGDTAANVMIPERRTEMHRKLIDFTSVASAHAVACNKLQVRRKLFVLLLAVPPMRSLPIHFVSPGHMVVCSGTRSVAKHAGQVGVLCRYDVLVFVVSVESVRCSTVCATTKQKWP